MIVSGKHSRYQIRRANREDLPSLPAIERAAGQQFKQFGFIQLNNTTLPLKTLSEAQAEDHVWVITTLDGEIVGFAVASTNQEEIHLEEIDIEPLHKGQGLGRALIDAICDWAKTAGFKTMSLSTFREIPWNAPYYERLGFRVVPESDFTAFYREIREAEEISGLLNSQRVIMSKHL